MINKTIEKIEFSLEEIEKSGYEHFMLKEIFEQPKTVKELVVMARTQFWAEVYNKGVAQFNLYRNGKPDEKDLLLQTSINTFITSYEIKPDEAQSYLMLSTCLFIAGDQVE